jgi:hypothetical protein
MLSETERGNLALSSEDGAEILWVVEGDRVTLEASVNPNNYPAWGIQEMDKPVSEIVQHINTNLGGWFVRKSNVEGLNYDSDTGYIAEPEEDGD